MLCGTLAGVEMGLHRAGIPHRAGGVAAARRVPRLGAVRSRAGGVTSGGEARSRGQLKCSRSTAKKPPACCARRAAGHRFTNCRRTAGRNRTPTPTRSRMRSSASSARRSAAGRSARHPPASAAFCAPIWMKMIRPSPASYDAGELRLIGIEAEIAFRLGRDLPARAAALRSGRGHRGSGAASGDRGRRFPLCGFPLARPALDPGRQFLEWRAGLRTRRCRTGRSSTSASTRITVTEDGEPFADSAGGAARDPIAALVDFANLMNGRGGAKAGTFVTTGSWTGMVFTKRGARIVADFGPLGRVEVAFPLPSDRAPV